MGKYLPWLGAALVVALVLRSRSAPAALRPAGFPATPAPAPSSGSDWRPVERFLDPTIEGSFGDRLADYFLG